MRGLHLRRLPRDLPRLWRLDPREVQLLAQHLWRPHGAALVRRRDAAVHRYEQQIMLLGHALVAHLEVFALLKGPFDAIGWEWGRAREVHALGDQDEVRASVASAEDSTEDGDSSRCL